MLSEGLLWYIATFSDSCGAAALPGIGGALLIVGLLVGVGVCEGGGIYILSLKF